ncbi:hypothetical protein LOTGIDRAFT_238330 [Lottia gigantea]|uniref:Uncharacterized protein n=1 Tax=Lottia gigantea TaxID=225164 RepID=V4B557_LOTGI|nr:hypothetical protein LOTGIDRAFT_238330 [Lottia gigantea]ESP01112.1 hypothetical protein LOTGIDRAFT_238330 [Lottia gigantea]
MGSLNSKSDNLASTPMKGAVGGMRHLDVDPRSPGLDRTPIVVDKTPDLNLGIGILDPRSPTAGIVRTPIVNVLNDKGEGGEDSLLINNSHVGNKMNFEGSDESGRVSDLSGSTELNSLSLSDVDECSNLLSVKDENSKKSKTKNQAKPKQLFPAMKRTVLMKNDIPRSPLANVPLDSNSPRNIVQRKHIKKIDTARSCRLDSNFCPLADKENM